MKEQYFSPFLVFLVICRSESKESLCGLLKSNFVSSSRLSDELNNKVVFRGGETLNLAWQWNICYTCVDDPHTFIKLQLRDRKLTKHKTSHHWNWPTCNVMTIYCAFSQIPICTFQSCRFQREDDFFRLIIGLEIGIYKREQRCQVPNYCHLNRLRGLHGLFCSLKAASVTSVYGNFPLSFLFQAKVYLARLSSASLRFRRLFRAVAQVVGHGLHVEGAKYWPRLVSFAAFGLAVAPRPGSPRISFSVFRGFLESPRRHAILKFHTRILLLVEHLHTKKPLKIS